MELNKKENSKDKKTDSKKTESTAKKDSKKLEKKAVSLKKDKPSFVERTKKFFKGVLNELKKVHWPNRREVMIYTVVVLVAVLLMAAIIWGFDSLFAALFGRIID